MVDDSGISDDGDDVDDAPSGTDAEFSGDPEVSLSVPGESVRLDEQLAALETNATASEELASFLNGNRKAVLVHKSYQYADGLDRVVGYARRSARDRVAVALEVPLQRSAAKTRHFVSRFPNTAIRFVDPGLHLHGDCYGEVGTIAQRNWSYFGTPIPVAGDAQWTHDLLQAQAAAGATVLLTPTGKVEEANAAQSLRDLMAHVALARSIVGKAPMFVNVTLDKRWLTTQSLRDQLLDEIVDSNERHWYIRVRWPILEPAYGQLIETSMLEGYADLTAVCSEEEKIVVYPNSDLTGWVMSALGAGGFGTATSISDRRFADVRRMGSQPGQPRPEPKKRYFSRPVLHTLEQPTHHALLGQPGYDPCGCRFCKALMPDRNAPGSWDLAAAGYHYVQKTVMLSADLSPNPRQRARRKVREARRFVEGLPGALQLTGDDRPAHLRLWERLLT